MAARSSVTAWGKAKPRGAAGAPDTVITNALILDHWGIVKADIAIRDGRISAIGKAGNPAIQPGCDDPHRPGHGDHRGRRQDHHGRRHGLAHPLHLPAANRGSACLRHHHHAGRRHRPRHRHVRHDLHARRLAHRPDDRGGGRLPDEPRLRRKGQCLDARRTGGTDRGRRLRAEAARGLGARRRRRSTVACPSPTITTCRS